VVYNQCTVPVVARFTAPSASPRGTRQRARDANISTDAIWSSWLW
jgi:hypothetical protein